MNRLNTIRSLLACPVLLCACLPAPADDWMTWRSTYTHDPATGLRIDQYAPIAEPLSPDQGNLVRSGYRHYRSTLQGSTSADNMHIVQEWGRPVMPYEHWRFPYRPYGVPYQQWGPPVPGVFSNFNFNGNFSPWSGPAAAPMPGAGLPGAVPGAGMPGAGMPGAGMPGAGMPLLPPGYGGYPASGYPGGSSNWPLIPPYQPAPWLDGLYPSAPPLGR